MAGPSLPSGTVTFLFTDIEGSTHLLHQLGDAYVNLLADQRRLLRAALGDNNGHEVDTQGDAFFYSFSRAKDAVLSAVSAQKAIADHSWPQGVSLRVRMGLHTGEPIKTEEGYVGMDVHRSARICSAGHGGQILLSGAIRVLVENDLPEGVSLRDLGEHRLKDLQHPEGIFQLLHPDLPSDFPSLKSLDIAPNNLPIQLTRFIGREKEIAEVKGLFSTTRLLTLTGSGGCGKTRLGLQVVADLLEEFPDGVWVVELASLSDPNLVIQETASVLGIREDPTMGEGSLGTSSATTGVETLLTRLTDYLKSKGLLLFLDNCEHLIEACIKLVDVLLRSSPNLKVLVASREALGIAGESTYQVPSLSIPDLQNPPLGGNLMTYEAPCLFVDRALAAASTFTVTNENAPAVAQICHRLDGIPLAIELAAARVKVLSVEQITKLLDDRFRLLTGGSRSALPRQQTLRAAIDWSHNLLSESERTLFRRLSAFVGGWTLEAAEAICSDEGIEEYKVLDLLTGLVDKSMVAVEEQTGEARYRLLETVRQYARDKLLESEEGEGLRARHLDWFLDLAERAEPELRGPDRAEWLDRLEVEHDNLKAALEWSETGKEGAEAGLRLAGTLWDFWHARGYLYEGGEWLERVLSRSSSVSVSTRAKALMGAGFMAHLQWDYGRATVRFNESLAMSRELGDKKGIANCLNGLGAVARMQGDFSRATPLLEESLALWRELGDGWNMAWSLRFLGLAASNQEDYSRALELLEESVALFREIGDKGSLSYTLPALGYVVWKRGDYNRGKALLEEGLALSRELGNKGWIALSLNRLGRFALNQEDYGRAAELLEESLTLSLDRKVVELEEGDKGFPPLLEGFGGVAVGQGQAKRAARLYGAAEALREANATPILLSSERKEYDVWVATARAKLGEKDFKAAWAEGRGMSPEEAIEYALKTGH